MDNLSPKMSIYVIYPRFGSPITRILARKEYVMFVTIKKRSLLIILSVLLVLCIIVTTSVAVATIDISRGPTIVIDPGHGGQDGGVTGTNTGVKESDINIKVSLILKSYLEADGFNVVMTRSDEGGTVSGAFNKLEDMRKRKETILSANPELIISIHCNKYPSSSSRRGAQVFFNENSPSGIKFANILQSVVNDLNNEHVGRTFSALRGDYYILNCSSAPSAIVECGFLSNPDDEKLLLSDDYLETLARKLALGIYLYLQENIS